MECSRWFGHYGCHHCDCIRYVYRDSDKSGLHSHSEPDGHGQYDPYGSYHAIGTNNILYP